MVFEPIILCMSIYLSFIYSLLYLLFFAFPIAFEEVRGWNEGLTGTAFIAVMVSGEGGHMSFSSAHKTPSVSSVSCWPSSRCNTKKSCTSGQPPRRAQLPKPDYTR